MTCFPVIFGWLSFLPQYYTGGRCSTLCAKLGLAASFSFIFAFGRGSAQPRGRRRTTCRRQNLGLPGVRLHGVPRSETKIGEIRAQQPLNEFINHPSLSQISNIFSLEVNFDVLYISNAHALLGHIRRGGIGNCRLPMPCQCAFLSSFAWRIWMFGLLRVTKFEVWKWFGLSCAFIQFTVYSL